MSTICIDGSTCSSCLALLLLIKRLSDVLPEQEWFNNIDNVQASRAYTVQDFMRFTGIVGAQEFRSGRTTHQSKEERNWW